MKKRKIRSKRMVPDEKIKEIQKMYDNLAVDGGDSDTVIFTSIASWFGIGKSTVRSIIKREGYYK